MASVYFLQAGKTLPRLEADIVRFEWTLYGGEIARLFWRFCVVGEHRVAKQTYTL